MFGLLQVKPGQGSEAPTTGAPKAPDGITLTSAEHDTIEAILSDRFFDGGAQLRRAVHRAVRRARPAEANFTPKEEGLHFLGMTAAVLHIEFEGTTYTDLTEGVRAIYRAQKADYKRRVEEANRPIVPSPVDMKAQRWAAMPQLVRALLVAAHESTDEKERAFCKRLVDAVRRTPTHVDPSKPAPDFDF